ncbi:MAG: J domain-containing protein [Clostridiales bacterium]|nr:J domain-containing protein [Clostridiales bacterium]
MSVNDPYQVLGISPNATDDEVKAAYREMARKYHPDNYSNNPLSDLAQEKMQEINEAYDWIIRQRRNGGSRAGTGGGRASSRYADVRSMINSGRIQDAEILIDGVPAGSRDAEWYFLKGSILYRKGWLEDAYQNFSAACQMDPGNAEYQAAVSQMNARRQTGGYHTAGVPTRGGGCSSCDICSALICTDCCCECMGGDFIPCC